MIIIIEGGKMEMGWGRIKKGGYMDKAADRLQPRTGKKKERKTAVA